MADACTELKSLPRAPSKSNCMSLLLQLMSMEWALAEVDKGIHEGVKVTRANHIRDDHASPMIFRDQQIQRH